MSRQHVADHPGLRRALADPSESYKSTGYSAFAEILLAGYDASGDGALSQSEFGVAMRDLAPEKAAGVDFHAIDLDGSGGLDRGELSAWQDDTIDSIAAGEQGGN